MAMKPAPRSVLQRGFRLGKLGFSLTGSYLGYQVQNLVLGENQKTERRHRFRQNASKRLRQELESLQGPVMKLGQMLSTQSLAVPEDFLQELTSLQMRAPGMHPTLARAQFKSALGKYPEEIFKDFEPAPFAAASLGQVHRAATHSGQQVVVKIQYPGIRKAVENDLKLLRSATFPGRLAGYGVKAILDEVERGFLEETNYILEAKNLELFQAGLASFSYLTVPKVIWETTRERVLTMTLVPGAPGGEFLKRPVAQSVRNLIGSRLFELYHYQIQFLGSLHADHHPGNFLLQSDGRIGLVDFGCVKRLSIDGAEIVRCCTQRVWERGQEHADHLLHLVFGNQMSLSRARKMLPAFTELVDIMFPLKGEGGRGVVDFGQPALLEAQGRCMVQALKDKITNPEFAFIARTELGLYSLLHQLKARINTGEILQRLNERAKRLTEKTT